MLIKHSNFYESIDTLHKVISTLDFVDSVYGLEVKDFNHCPEGIKDHISHMINIPIKLSETSGKFRKPYPIIHFEDFNDKEKFVLAVALEETKFKTYKHSSGIQTVFEIENVLDFIKSEMNPENWKVIDEITLQPNDFIVFNPWMWHSFDDKIIQVFNLEIDHAI